MGTVKRFKELEVWQQARELVRDVYTLTRKKEFSKYYGLKDQIRRSSVSVMSNISEGFESRTSKRFINYLGHSKGSCGETRSISYVALDCEYISESEFQTLYDRCTTISQKTQKLIGYLEGYSSNDRIKDILVDYET